MFETIIQLKPESEWRKGFTLNSIIADLDRRVQVPGLTNSWTMPIKTRIDMLSTGSKPLWASKFRGRIWIPCSKLVYSWKPDA
jgi:Cu(I)/Ag(I) efflux system membrane protein CusA/SilA